MQKIERPESKQPMPKDAKLVFRGVVFDVYQWEQELFDGSKTTFEKLTRPDTVVVIPVMDDGKLLLLNQEQPGKVCFTGFPCGGSEEGEDVLTTAKRELLEEAGYEAEELTLWCAQQPVSKIDWVVYVFIAKGLKKVASVNPDMGEKFSPRPITFDEFLDLAHNKDFSDKEISKKLFEAKLDPVKREELRKLFSPK